MAFSGLDVIDPDTREVKGNLVLSEADPMLGHYGIDNGTPGSHRIIAANVAKLPPQAATAVEACSSGRRACPYRAAGSAACRQTDDRILTGNGLRTASTP